MKKIKKLLATINPITCKKCGLPKLKKERSCPKCGGKEYTRVLPKGKDILTPQNVLLTRRGKIICLH